MKSTRQSILGIAVLINLFIGTAIAQTSAHTPQTSAQHSHSAQSSGEVSPSSAFADMSLDFELLNADGETVKRTDFLGSNLLVGFGFTHCPDVCPVIAANMAKAIQLSDKDAMGVFISVDTERDTPEVTGRYANYFGKRMIGLSGSHQQVSNAAKNFNITFVVTKTPDNYSVQHSPGTFLISPDGELIEVYAINADPKEIAAAMK